MSEHGALLKATVFFNPQWWARVARGWAVLILKWHRTWGFMHQRLTRISPNWIISSALRFSQPRSKHSAFSSKGSDCWVCPNHVIFGRQNCDWKHKAFECTCLHVSEHGALLKATVFFNPQWWAQIPYRGSRHSYADVFENTLCIECDTYALDSKLFAEPFDEATTYALASDIWLPSWVRPSVHVVV